MSFLFLNLRIVFKEFLLCILFPPLQVHYPFLISGAYQAPLYSGNLAWAVLLAWNTLSSDTHVVFSLIVLKSLVKCHFLSDIFLLLYIHDPTYSTLFFYS